MIEVYKLLTGKEKINYEQFFILAEDTITSKGKIKTGYKEIFLQPESCKQLEQSIYQQKL